MNYSQYKNYINAGIFIGSILLTRLSTMVSPTLAYACTIISIILLSYLLISLVYDIYYTKNTYYSRPLRNLLPSGLIFFLGLLALRWLQGYFLRSSYEIFATINLTLITTYVYAYSYAYIAPRVKQYFGKNKQNNSD